jgi:transporter family-2 protein
MYVLLAIANGLMAVSSRIANAALSGRIGSLAGSLVNHAVGALVSGALLAAGLGAGEVHLAGAPWWAWTGGVLGVLVVGASNAAVRAAGATLFGVVLVAGQLATSAVIDHFGLLGQSPIAVTPARALGLVLLAVGAALVATSAEPDEAESRPSGDAGGA